VAGAIGRLTIAGLFGNCREMPQDIAVINQQSSVDLPDIQVLNVEITESGRQVN
jgi:hypothetical protein